MHRTNCVALTPLLVLLLNLFHVQTACERLLTSSAGSITSSAAFQAGNSGPELNGSGMALSPSSPLLRSDLVIVLVSSTARLLLVEASRPARAGIQTVIAIEQEAKAAELTAQHQKAHLETYVACPVSPLAQSWQRWSHAFHTQSAP